ncbi:MAG: phosphatase, partial [Eubacteriales bacterium]
ILVDTHTHNLLSGHAYSTLLENMAYAAKIGLEGIVNSDHGPAILGASPEFCLSVLRTVPQEIDGVRLYRGIEANILDYTGKLDISRGFLKMTEFVIASLHDIVIAPASREEHLAGYMGAFANPYVDVIGHSGNPAFDLDREELVRSAGRANKLIEINNHSFRFRPGSEINCNEIIRLCIKYNVRITVSSDAHFAMGVGSFENVLAALEQNGFPEELIVNLNRKSMDCYLAERQTRLAK